MCLKQRKSIVEPIRPLIGFALMGGFVLISIVGLAVVIFNTYKANKLEKWLKQEYERWVI